jgi:hypothetical protein
MPLIHWIARPTAGNACGTPDSDDAWDGDGAVNIAEVTCTACKTVHDAAARRRAIDAASNEQVLALKRRAHS